MPALEMDFSWCSMVPHLPGCDGPRKITLTKLDVHCGSLETPEEIAGDYSADDGAAVAAGGDDFVEVFDLEAVVKGVANAVGGVEERDGAENEKVEPYDWKCKESGDAGVLGGFGPAERSGDSQNEEVDGDKKSGDDTAGAEEDPEERFDAKFGRLRVHSAFYPLRLAREARQLPLKSKTMRRNWGRKS